LIIGLRILMAVGLAASVFLPTPLAIIALSVAAIGYFAATPLFWTLPSAMLTGGADTSGLALINSVGNLGGFIAPNLKTWFEQQTASPWAGIVLMGVICVAAALLLALPIGLRSSALTTPAEHSHR
jgi:MFS transporter, ACS family, inner membrane transport protein